jgi:hypothetical protein
MSHKGNDQSRNLQHNSQHGHGKERESDESSIYEEKPQFDEDPQFEDAPPNENAPNKPLSNNVSNRNERIKSVESAEEIMNVRN